MALNISPLQVEGAARDLKGQAKGAFKDAKGEAKGAMQPCSVCIPVSAPFISSDIRLALSITFNCHEIPGC